ncbi:hypothetical protein PTTG_28881 [Puccinia triticina 1-1 BBBD Race 1]|uniref:RING-type domain-containing protein n=2 Tax=Puccinia triticina TaxID=208348 RepID=A0A180G856_PUCT1|nr:uncharacterized protein PtA15_15A315 [Puccinia triticina]OAV88887.1 hypothetical protein PTTG_28881 [Puccinia triticina 1-1 BBBD Race 1]WAQ91922.1 hypothetical protein PtA15_15A315 [Puccinia triticina]WAR62726.1 hypothetical protein PtB15_15B313 [Puccinia triticina]
MAGIWYSTMEASLPVGLASHDLQQQELEARRLAFDRNTIISAYMPYNQQLHTKSTEQCIISLDQAVHMLATTEASQHCENNALENPQHAGGGLESANSESKNLQHQQAQAYSQEDKRTNDDEPNSNHDENSTSNPPNPQIVDVVVGNQGQDPCAICLEKFEPPVQDAMNQWAFSTVARMRQCGHYFHPKCIQPWLVEYRNDGCPTCRALPTPEAEHLP